MSERRADWSTLRIMQKLIHRFLPPEGIVFLAFTKERPVGRICLSGRSLRVCVIATILVTLVTVGLMMAGVRELVDRQRLIAVEAENDLLRAGMKQQEAQVRELTLQMQRVRGLESALRTLSGFKSDADPLVATGQGKAPRLPTASP